MTIHQLRNATLILSFADRQLLVDPMFSEVGTLPGFKFFGPGRQKNPLVPLPPQSTEALKTVTDILITHEHPDHLDSPGLAWVKASNLNIWSSPADAKNLQKKGVNAKALVKGAMGLEVEVIPTQHGRGLMGYLMGPVFSYYLEAPGEPSVLLTSDSILSPSLQEAVDRLKPDVIIAPAGSANIGIGPNILFSVDELLSLIQSSKAEIVLNHLEALDHCPTTRRGLRKRMDEAGLSHRVHIPEDGERVEIMTKKAHQSRGPIKVHPSPSRLQKWLTAPFSGT